MTKLLLLFARYPWLWLGLLLALSAVAATQLDRVRVNISADEMLVADDPKRTFSNQIAADFGEPQIELVVVDADATINVDQLRALAEAVAALEALDFVAETHSLFNTPYVKSVDGFLDKAPYLDPVPATEGEIALALERARTNPLLRGVLVGEDTPAIAVALVIDRDVSHSDQQISEAIQATISPLRGTFQDAYVIGFAEVRNELATRIAEEQWRLAPVAVGALLLILFLLLRQLLDILIPLLTAGISILWTLGLMGWLEIPLNVVTSMVPILLIVVGSTEDVHLLAEFRHAQQQGDGAGAALRHMARRMGRTVLLTFATTFAGFLSVGLSGIELLSQFGLVASAGLLFNFVATIILIPSALALAGHWNLDGKRHAPNKEKSPAGQRFWRLLSRHRRAVLPVATLFTVIAASGIPRIHVEHNPIDSLGTTSPTAINIDRFNSGFAGLESFSIVVESGIQDTFLHARYLDELTETQQFVQQLAPTFSVTSFVDYLTLLNRAFLEDDSAGPPRSNDEIAELMLFLDHDRIRGYATEDFSRARIQIRHQMTATEEVRAIIAAIEQHLDEHLDAGLRARVTGDSYLTLSATDSMINGQLESVLLILLLFVTIVSLIFTDLRIGLLAALPNMFPVVVLFGTMGYAGIPLNIGTTMAAAIAIGLAVDDTLHFMLRYNQELCRSRSQELAMQATIQQEALPVVGTSIAMAGGFLTFALSGFEPVAQFGLLSALVILIALLADFVITPLIMSSLRLVTLWEMLSPRVRDHVIPQSPLFRGMRVWQIRRFVLSSTMVDFRAGEAIFRRDDVSDALYLIMRGRVEVVLPPEAHGQKSPVINTFVTGQVFGDVALFAEEPRRTNAIALEPTTLMILTGEGIRNVTLFHPFVASRLFFNLARDVSCRWVKFVERVRKQQAARHDDGGPAS